MNVVAASEDGITVMWIIDVENSFMEAAAEMLIRLKQEKTVKLNVIPTFCHINRINIPCIYNFLRSFFEIRFHFFFFNNKLHIIKY